MGRGPARATRALPIKLVVVAAVLIALLGSVAGTRAMDAEAAPPPNSGGSVPQSGAAGARPLETILQDDALLLHRPAKDVDATMARIVGLGVDRVRLTAVWSTIAPAADAAARPPFDATDPAAYPPANWTGLDTAITLADRHGLAVDIDVGFWAPRWATDAPEAGRARLNVDADEFASFAQAVARRYSGTFTPVLPDPAAPMPPPSSDAGLLEGALGLIPGGRSGPLAGPAAIPGFAVRASEDQRPPAGQPSPAASAVAPGPLPAVRMYTVWNEPNHPGFLLPQWSRDAEGRTQAVAPHLYRAMLEKAYPAIKSVDARNVVLVGGTSSIGGDERKGNGGVPPLRFLRELACVDDMLRPLSTPACSGYKAIPGDGWAHHPYSLYKDPGTASKRPDDVSISDLDRLTTLLTRLASAGRIAPELQDVWLTEYGYETNDRVRTKLYGVAEQAYFLAWSEYLAAHNPNIRSYAQFLLNDIGTEAAIAQGPRGRAAGSWQTGLFYEDGQPKASMASFRNPTWIQERPAAAGRTARRGRGGPARRRPARPAVRRAAARRAAARREAARLARRSISQVTVWTHLRTARGPAPVRVLSRKGSRSPWTVVQGRVILGSQSGSELLTDAGGSFELQVVAARGRTYRVDALQDGSWATIAERKPHVPARP